MRRSVWEPTPLDLLATCRRDRRHRRRACTGHSGGNSAAVGTFCSHRTLGLQKSPKQVFRCGTNTVQIVRHLDPAEYPRVIKLLPAAVRRVQVVHVEDHAALEQIAVYAPYVHAFLRLDSGRPSAPVPELGRHGARAQLGGECPVRAPLTSAGISGGLTPVGQRRPGNRATVRRTGCDACSGVRTGRYSFRSGKVSRVYGRGGESRSKRCARRLEGRLEAFAAFGVRRLGLRDEELENLVSFCPALDQLCGYVLDRVRRSRLLLAETASGHAENDLNRSAGAP